MSDTNHKSLKEWLGRFQTSAPQSDPSDHVTINDQHVRRQLEFLMQMRKLNTVEVPVQGHLLWLNDIPKICSCQCQSDTLPISDLHISQLRLTDLSFTCTAQTNIANPASHCHVTVKSWTLGGQLLPDFLLTRSHFSDYWEILHILLCYSFLLMDTIFCSLFIWLHSVLPLVCLLYVCR